MIDLFYVLLTITIILLILKLFFSFAYFYKIDKLEKTEIDEKKYTVLQPILSGDPRLEEDLKANLKNTTDMKFIWLVDKSDKVAINTVENILKKCNSEYITNYSVINIDNTLHIMNNTDVLMKVYDNFKVESDKRLIDYVGFEYLEDIVKMLNSYIFKFMKIKKYINYVNYTIYNETNLENTYIVGIEGYKIVIRRMIENKKLFFIDVVNIEINNIINFIDLNKEDSILLETIRLILKGNNIIYKEYMRDDNRILFDLIIYNTEEFKKSKYVNFINNYSLLFKDYINFQNDVLNIQDNHILGFENKFIIEIKNLDKFKQIIKNINDEYREDKTIITKIKNILHKTHQYADYIIEDEKDKIILKLCRAVLEYDKHKNKLILNNAGNIDIYQLDILYKDIKIIEDGFNKIYNKK